MIADDDNQTIFITAAATWASLFLYTIVEKIRLTVEKLHEKSTSDAAVQTGRKHRHGGGSKANAKSRVQVGQRKRWSSLVHRSTNKVKDASGESTLSDDSATFDEQSMPGYFASCNSENSAVLESICDSMSLVSNW